MLPPHALLRDRLHAVIRDKADQGHAVAGLAADLDALPESYDALAAFAERLADLPLREGWPYVEPNDLGEIWAECDPARPLGAIGAVDPQDAARRVEAAFLARVAGCVLGKPLEFDPTLDELRDALEPLNEWPLRDYIPERALDSLRLRHPQWDECVRERITHVAPDDDINYTILGMLLLEQHGIAFTKGNVRDLWLLQLPVAATFGPERTMLARAAMHTFSTTDWAPDPAGWARILNPLDEFCGALIRVDAYGYACPGRPALAAELAWRDASFTHRRTGVYAAMFVAAALAAAPVARAPLDVFEVALGFVPRQSRFHEVARDSLAEVAAAPDWLEGYRRIHARHAGHTHCRIYQEIGTLMNTVRFAESAGDGICKQVMQGNDTDSFGATAGSLLGLLLGPGHLEDRWIAPFHDDVHLALAMFHERSLSAIAARMSRLPELVSAATL